MNRNIAILFWCAALFSVARAQKVNLEIYASRFDSIPIGVVDFKSKSPAAIAENEPWKVIANDFDLCGRFHVIAKKAFDSAAFAAEGASIYVDGEYVLEGEAVSFTCYVYDVATRGQLFSKVYTGDRKSLRSCAHKFTNEIYDLLYGEKGIFESRVLFVRNEGANKNIAIMDFDGGNQRQITKGKILNLFPAFVDASTMLWTSYLRGKPDIYTGSISDGKPNVVAASRGIQVSPAFSTIDNTVVYASSKNGSLDIYTSNLDGSNVRQITAGGCVETAPCWSPSGYQIAFTSDKSGNPQIYVMDADGANQRRLTYKSRYSDSPSWSPKGDKIAFASMKPETGKLDIWTVAPDGSNETQVTTMPGHNEYPTWSPDGSLIGFINRSGGKSDFYIMKPDGSRIKRITSGGDVQMPDWGN